MKSVIAILATTLFILSPVPFLQAQGTPKPGAGKKGAAPAGAVKRTDVYHVHFTKACAAVWSQRPAPVRPGCWEYNGPHSGSSPWRAGLRALWQFHRAPVRVSFRCALFGCDQRRAGGDGVRGDDEAGGTAPGMK